MPNFTPGLMTVVEGRGLMIGDVNVADVFDTAEGLEGSDAEADANAARMALCWNCHADLLAACVAWIDYLTPGPCLYSAQETELIVAMKAAIARATA